MLNLALTSTPASPLTPHSPEGTAYAASVADFAHLYSDRPTDLMLLCEFILNTSSAPASEPLLYHTLLQLYLTGRMDSSAEGGSKEGGSGGSSRGGGSSSRRQEAAGQEGVGDGDALVSASTSQDLTRG